MNFRRNCAQLDAPVSLGPVREGVPLDLPDQMPLPEGAIDDHGDAAVTRQRQDARLDLPVEHIVGHLHEVDRLRAHDLLDEIVPPTLRCGDPDVSHLSRRLHGEERPQVLLPGDEIVHLEEVEAGHAPIGARPLDLARSARAAGGPDLLGREQRLRIPELAQSIADGRLRRTVHRRGVDHPAAQLEEGGHDRGAFVLEFGIVADVERDPGAEADGRQSLARRRNGPRHWRTGLSPRLRQWQQSCRRGRHCTFRERPPRPLHGTLHDSSRIHNSSRHGPDPAGRLPGLRACRRAIQDRSALRRTLRCEGLQAAQPVFTMTWRTAV